MVISGIPMKCLKCDGEMATMPIDLTTASLLGGLGRWFCTKCGWCPSLNKYLPKRSIEIYAKEIREIKHEEQEEPR